MKLLKITNDVNHPNEYRLWVEWRPESPVTFHDKKDSNGVLFAHITIDGVCQYGLRQIEDGPEHEAGYVWSSRPGVINRTFGIQTLNAYINGYSGRALTVEAVKKILPSEYTVIRKGGFEPTYIIIKK